MISINGKIISEDSLAREMQYHPADGVENARNLAAEALVVKGLLLEEAQKMGLEKDSTEATIAALLSNQLTVTDSDHENCKTFFKKNQDRFMGQDLYEASHILLAAPPDDVDARKTAMAQAKNILATLKQSPEKFEILANAHSACPSAKTGGSLGQVGRGDLVSEIETFLFNLEEGQLCPVPVESKFGVHVLKLNRKIEGQPLPFEAIKGKILNYLREQEYRSAVEKYISGLVAKAEIEGVTFNSKLNPALSTSDYSLV